MPNPNALGDAGEQTNTADEWESLGQEVPFQRTEDVNQAWEEAYAAKPKLDLARDVENTSRFFDEWEKGSRLPASDYLEDQPLSPSEWQPRMHAVNEAVANHISYEEKQGMSGKEMWQKTAEELREEAMADAEKAGKNYQEKQESAVKAEETIPGRTEDVNQAWEEAYAAKPKLDLARDADRMAQAYKEQENGGKPDFSLEDHPINNDMARKTAVYNALHDHNDESELLRTTKSSLLQKTAEELRKEAMNDAEKAGQDYQERVGNNQ